MKMHPKPMIRHTWPVIECNALVVNEPALTELTVHLVLQIDGKTQRVCMTPEEARAIGGSLQLAADDASPQKKRHIVFGRSFAIVAEFPDTEEGARDANAYMESHHSAALLQVIDGRVILADKADKGIRV